MAGDPQVHELLPWYLTKTLTADEANAFARHLPGCEDCRREMETLDKIRAAVDRHGDSFLADHPPAERLVAAVRGELDAEAEQTVRRHLALCVTCATEARWAGGEAVAGPAAAEARRPAAPRARRPASSWLPLVAAAAVLAVALLVTFLPSGSESAPVTTSVLEMSFLSSPERAPGIQQVESRPGQPLYLILELELPESAFPATVEIVAADGRIVHRNPEVPFEALLNGVYLSVRCLQSDCVPGDYRARVRPGPADEIPLEIPFRVVAP